jgi:hypothetical protein
MSSSAVATIKKVTELAIRLIKRRTTFVILQILTVTTKVMNGIDLFFQQYESIGWSRCMELPPNHYDCVLAN